MKRILLPLAAVIIVAATIVPPGKPTAGQSVAIASPAATQSPHSGLATLEEFQAFLTEHVLGELVVTENPLGSPFWQTSSAPTTGYALGPEAAIQEVALEGVLSSQDQVDASIAVTIDFIDRFAPGAAAQFAELDMTAPADELITLDDRVLRIYMDADGPLAFVGTAVRSLASGGIPIATRPLGSGGPPATLVGPTGGVVASPSPTATPEPVSRKLTSWDSNLAWRWLDGSEFECTGEVSSCWSVEVRSKRTCERGIVVEGDLKDENEDFIEDFRVRRKAQAGAGKRVALQIGTADQDAHWATVTSIECLRAPAPKPKTTKPKPRPTVSSNCTPGYSPCLPPASDVDCAGGSGNGPAYTRRGTRYRVTGSDPYRLDTDNDGIGCE